MFAILAVVILAAFDSGMSADEMRQTGLEKLNVQEKAALGKWIEKRYSKKLVAQNNKQGPILEENLKSGSLIRLSDGSMWEIKPSDTPITLGWITPVEIKVSNSDDSAYPYNLTNTLTGSTVKARKPTAEPTKK